MKMIGMNYKWTRFCPGFAETSDAAFSFDGDEGMITERIREPYETLVRKYRLTQERIDAFLELVEKYRMMDWINQEPRAPKVYTDDEMHDVYWLTLLFDDGREATITFREVAEEIGKEASDAFWKLYVAAVKEENKLSEETQYPTLRECRGIQEEHGPVIAVETHSFSMGMMHGSNSTHKQLIERIPDQEGMVRVTVTNQSGDQPEVSDTKETASDVFLKLQEISDQENLSAWNYVCRDPSRPVECAVMDYSCNGTINIYYDDSLITGCPRVRRSIEEAAREMGGAECCKELNEIINNCVAASGANASAGVSGSNDTWDCKCGAKGLTGKFCPECGGPKG